MANALASYYFPDIYYDNLISSASSVKYVSASGSDSNNGNSVATAYKTIAYAVSANSATSSSITIVILPGTYVEVPITAGSSYATAVLTDGNKPRVFVCSPGQVKIQFSDATMSYGPFIANFQNSGSAVYGAIFERNNGGKTANYATALFCGSATVGNLKGNFYNCAFTETNANNSWALLYDNESSITSQVNYCTFKFGAGPQSDYNGGSGMTITASVFNTVAPVGNSVKVSVLASQSVSTAYVTTGVTTAGVYSGTYSWNGLITQPQTTPMTVSSSTGATPNIRMPYTIYTFNSSGSITFGTTGYIDYIVVAGGGGGGGSAANYSGGGGGGAGGYRIGSFAVTSGTQLTVTVGGGGSGSNDSVGTSGSNSVFSTITSTGGGAGANANGGAGNAATVGGSGGGGGYDAPVRTGAAGTVGQGNNGGNGSTTSDTGGGGGGAGAVGSNGSTGSYAGGIGGAGGAGLVDSWTGSNRYLAGGGGGGAYGGYASATGAGGAGGGANGGAISGGNGTPGTPYTGGGGGGATAFSSATAGGAGGSGIVILKVFTGYSPGLYANPTSISSGSSTVITLATSGLTDGTTVAYTITGVTSAQLNGTSLTGNFTVTSNTATLTIPTNSNVISATMIITTSLYNVSVPIIYPVSISTATTGIGYTGDSSFLVNPIAGQMNITKSALNIASYDLGASQSLYPIAGQMNVYDSVATVTDVTLGTKISLPTTLNIVNTPINPYTTITTSIAGPIPQGIIKVFGDIPRREYWV